MSCAALRSDTASLAPKVLGDAKRPGDLGQDFGHGLTEREIDYFIRDEWARTGEDVLWRRTKCGLGMPGAARERVAQRVAATVEANRR